MTAVIIGGVPVPTYPTLASLPASAPHGSLAVVLASDTLYEFDSTGGWQIIGPAGGGGGGTVTSVGVADISTAPIFSVSASPVTSAGTIDLTLKVQPATEVLAGPISGSSAQPMFRSLVLTDLPTFVYEYTLNTTDISNNYITLPQAPEDPSLTLLNVVGGPMQLYTIDYTVSGSQLFWFGLGLQGVLVAGDILIVQGY